jgi:hypothetical protein
MRLLFGKSWFNISDIHYSSWKCNFDVVSCHSANSANAKIADVSLCLCLNRHLPDRGHTKCERESKRERETDRERERYRDIYIYIYRERDRDR